MTYLEEKVDILVNDNNDNIITGIKYPRNFQKNKYQAALKGDFIVDIALGNLSYDFQLIGPVKLSGDVFPKIIDLTEKSDLDLSHISCFSLIKLVLRNFDIIGRRVAHDLTIKRPLWNRRKARTGEVWGYT